MGDETNTRLEHYERFERPLPEWFRDAKLGIFVHWGAYSVPAWAEPIGQLGTIDDMHWYRHNPYAEWYANTIRIDGSPASQHHRTRHAGRPYDEFLDHWKAEDFDATGLIGEFARAGARYVIPTTKHHDGITLWDAPGTGTRNTVHRGPRRDLIADFACAARGAGLRFGAYYSGGLDWYRAPSPAIQDRVESRIPSSAEYAEYAHQHLVDLIERYQPDILWGDIGWPAVGHSPGPSSLADAFERFYDAVPDGVVNDRWSGAHWDFRTSEYEYNRSVECGDAWEHCRGTGYSFGYNQLERPEHALGGEAAIRLFVDVASRGGNLLLNVGPTASGTLPPEQLRTLRSLGAWNALYGDAIFNSVPLDGAQSSERPWVRWTRTGQFANAIIDASGRAEFTVPHGVDPKTARAFDGAPSSVLRIDGNAVELELPDRDVPGPVAIRFLVRPAV